MGKTLVLGATTNESRIAFMAIERLVEKGEELVLVGVREGEVAGISIQKEMPENGQFDTITMYIGPKHQAAYIDDILRLRPKRLIFNPGTFNPELDEKASAIGIATLEACTLVMLSTGSYATHLLSEE